MKLPNLSKDSRLLAILKKLDLNIGYRLYDENKRQISVNQVNETSIVEISSSLRMGKSEVGKLYYFYLRSSQVISSCRGGGGLVTDFVQNSWNLHSMLRKKFYDSWCQKVTECTYLGHVKRPSKVKKQALLNE